MIRIALDARHAAATLAVVALSACASARPETAASSVARGYVQPCAPGTALLVENGSDEAIRIIGAQTGDPNEARTKIIMPVVAPRQKAVVPGSHAELSRIYAVPIDNPTLPNNSQREVHHVDLRCIPDSVAFGS